MSTGIYSAVSGAVAETRRLEASANNLANADTPGFKTERMAFSEVLSRATEDGRTKITPSFVAAVDSRMDLKQGAIRPTGNTLDFALQGNGFFAVETGGQKVFCRGGSFHIRKDGILTDVTGRTVLGAKDSPIKVGVNPIRLAVSEDGTISTDQGPVGKFQLVEFTNPAVLQRLGDNLVLAPPEAGMQEAKATAVQQGFLESSNVDSVKEMVAMILSSRAYQAFHRVISIFNEVDKSAASSVGQER
ncbi:MAG: flagellar basal-body rod protein FlgF [Pseudomonadota bacterium]